jgi:hypothetical protein
MKPGDKVMVPRTGGGYSLGEILEIYTDGRPRPLAEMAYKTVKMSELRPTQREERFDDQDSLYL